MAIDLKALDDKIKTLDDQIKRLQSLRELALDPECGPLLEKLTISNGTSAGVAKTAPPARKLKGLMADIIKHVPEGGGGKTSRDIRDHMLAASYEFSSKDSLLTVKQNLRKLQKAGLIEKAETRPDSTVLWRKK
jgi:hypothetical protein